MLRWNQFEEKWLTKTLMKPSVRKNRDYVFSIFHQLNLKDAASYVAEVRPGASSSSLGLNPDRQLMQEPLCHRENDEALWSLSAMKVQSSISRRSLVKTFQTCCLTSQLTRQMPTVRRPPGELNGALFCPEL